MCLACSRAYVFVCLACLRALRAYVLTWSLFNCMLGLFVCLRAWYLLSGLRAHVLDMLDCSRAWRTHMHGVLACLHVRVLSVLAYSHICNAFCTKIFYVLPCLCTWCPCLSYLLYISKLNPKNSSIAQFVCIINLNIQPFCFY